ncbi:MAG: 6,7-dimethyl-8-ribityllumazine synthase [Planctomycetota bacterium]
MPRPSRGRIGTRGKRFAVVVARFNGGVTRRLLAGALKAFRARRVPSGAVDVFRVPGAFEIPVTALALARSGRYAAVVALGAVIRGETAHFEYVAGGVARGVMDASLATGVPVIFGVLTTETRPQALARAGGRCGNKGAEAAEAAIEMAGVMGRIMKNCRTGVVH